jgi:hypothetical protein
MGRNAPLAGPALVWSGAREFALADGKTTWSPPERYGVLIERTNDKVLLDVIVWNEGIRMRGWTSSTGFVKPVANRTINAPGTCHLTSLGPELTETMKLARSRPLAASPGGKAFATLPKGTVVYVSGLGDKRLRVRADFFHPDPDHDVHVLVLEGWIAE